MAILHITAKCKEIIKIDFALDVQLISIKSFKCKVTNHFKMK